MFTDKVEINGQVDVTAPVYAEMTLEELMEARDAFRAARALEGKVVEGKGAVE